jgi:transcriptional regulator with XRE-family HTH domain
MSQALLADRVGLTRSSIANLEAARQRMSLYYFVLISRALNIEVDKLLSEILHLSEPRISSRSLENELADSPESMRDFVHGAIARLQTSESEKQ